MWTSHSPHQNKYMAVQIEVEKVILFLCFYFPNWRWWSERVRIFKTGWRVGAEVIHQLFYAIGRTFHVREIVNKKKKKKKKWG